MTEQFAFAGFWRRLGAYTIDVLPITLFTAACFYVFLGFDETCRLYLADTSNLQHRIQFLTERNQIRDLSFVIWVLYSIVLEATALQGTLGKAAMGIRVVDAAGNRISVARSIGRNSFKLVSYLPIGLGFLWAAFSKKKQGWHDMVAKTYVVRRSSSVTSQPPKDSAFTV